MNSWDYLSMWNEASWNDAGNPNWDGYMQNSAPYSAEALARYRDGDDCIELIIKKYEREGDLSLYKNNEAK